MAVALNISLLALHDNEAAVVLIHRENVSEIVRQRSQQPR